MISAWRVLAAVLVATALGSGCGGSGAEEERVRTAVEDVFVAFVEGDGPGVCDGFTPEVVDQINAQIEANYPRAADRSCPEAIELLVPEGAKRFAGEAREKAEVTDVEIDGDRATARIGTAGERGLREQIELRKVGDEWLISDPGSSFGAGGPPAGSGAGAVSKAEAIRRADPICRRTRAALVALGRPPSYEQIEEARAYEERSAQIEREPLQNLKAVRPPPQDRRLYEQFVAALSLSRELGLEGIDNLERGQTKVAEADLRQRQAVVEEGARAAEAYGFNSCGRPAGGWGGFSP